MARPNPHHALLPSSDDIEQQFYDALRRGDVEKVMEVWSDDDDIACVHPGGQRFIGAAAIRASFDAVFSDGPVDAKPETVRRVVTHSSAVHSVLEHVQLMTEEGPRSGWVFATNVYVKTALGWRLVVHHASPGTPQGSLESAERGSTLH